MNFTDCDDIQINNSKVVQISSGNTVRWERKIHIVFNVNGGFFIQDWTLRPTNTVILPSPQHPNPLMQFTGWTINEQNIGSGQVSYDFSYRQDNYVLTASWKLIEQISTRSPNYVFEIPSTLFGNNLVQRNPPTSLIANNPALAQYSPFLQYGYKTSSADVYIRGSNKNSDVNFISTIQILCNEWSQDSTAYGSISYSSNNQTSKNGFVKDFSHSANEIFQFKAGNNNWCFSHEKDANGNYPITRQHIQTFSGNNIYRVIAGFSSVANKWFNPDTMYFEVVWNRGDKM